jgi:hypothetical protein
MRIRHSKPLISKIFKGLKLAATKFRVQESTPRLCVNKTLGAQKLGQPVLFVIFIERVRELTQNLVSFVLRFALQTYPFLQRGLAKLEE